MARKSSTVKENAMADALATRNRQRQPVSPDENNDNKESNPTLSVVSSSTGDEAERNNQLIEESTINTEDGEVTSMEHAKFVAPQSNWVRHTVGLQSNTRLKLQDAAHAQKEKKRHGRLKAGEPENEQEIAEHGITLALRELGHIGASD